MVGLEWYPCCRLKHIKLVFYSSTVYGNLQLSRDLLQLQEFTIGASGPTCVLAQAELLGMRKLNVITYNLNNY